MRLKNVFAGLALIAVILTSVFSVCSIQHPSAMSHSMQADTMLVSAFDGGCPLANVVNFQTMDKFSKVDPWVFWQSVTPSGVEHLASLRFLPTNLEVNVRDQKNRSEIPISITSPPLAYAFSQGILHPKKDSVA